MAEYRDVYEQLRKTGADFAAVAVDAPENSEAVRKQSNLPYTILCDTQRQIVKSWGVFDPLERGGIARPGVFIIDRGGIIRFLSIDTMKSRVSSSAILEFLASGMPNASSGLPRKSGFLGMASLWHATINSIRLRSGSTTK